MPTEQLLPTSQADKQAEKQEVKGYFETTGFDRWNRIYSDSTEVNRVQRNIRIGHQKTVDNVLAWLQEQGNLAGRSFCDAGCGVGSLTLPLAQAGAGSIAASDLSEAMVQEAARRAAEAGIPQGQSSSRPLIWRGSRAATTRWCAWMCSSTTRSSPPKRWCATWPAWRSST